MSRSDRQLIIPKIVQRLKIHILKLGGADRSPCTVWLIPTLVIVRRSISVLRCDRRLLCGRQLQVRFALKIIQRIDRLEHFFVIAFKFFLCIDSVRSQVCHHRAVSCIRLHKVHVVIDVCLVRISVRIVLSVTSRTFSFILHPDPHICHMTHLMV